MSGTELSGFLSIYPAKLLEYSLAAGYLVLFTAFWRYVRGRPAPVVVAEPRRARPAGATALAGAGWFALPGDVLLHPGHTWARPLADGLVEVGLDDLAARLLGPVAGMSLPRPGERVAQGSPAFAAVDGGRRVDLLSPVEGEVAEVNPLASSDLWQFEPYGAGWLFKVKPGRWKADERQLLAGEAARRWLEQASASLAARASPELGAVLQDGGAPLHGIARELEPDRWDELCREYFRT